MARRRVEPPSPRSPRAPARPGPRPTGLLLALSLAVPLGAVACATDPTPRNVIVILVDALRADRLGVYGNPRQPSPNIDRLAENALVYTNAYSPATWTVPGTASLFTGTLPVVHRINRPPEHQFAFSVLDDSYVLASEVFSRAGFTTGMVTTIGWVSEQANYDQGVDQFIQTDRLDEDLIEQARAFITEHRQDRFHLYLHLIDLHDWYDPVLILQEGHEAALAPDSALRSLASNTAEESYTRFTREFSQPGVLDTRDLTWLLEVYDRQIVKTDRLIGRLVYRLETEGLLQDTLIAVTADHGERFMEHGQLMHAGTGFYNESLRIPYVIADPGRFHGRTTITTPVSLIDLYPTLFDLTGVPEEPLFQGQSVLGEIDPPHPVFATDGLTWKVITRRWSYIVGRNREELYDLRVDPGERRNLAGDPEYAQNLADMRRSLQAKRDESRDHEYLAIVANPGEAEMTEEERRALKSLGYLQ